LVRIEIANQIKHLKLDRPLIRRAIQRILRQANIKTGVVSVAIVDDATIASLHGRYLNDPAPTDVLSFVLETGPEHLEGEVVVSYDTAVTRAKELHVPVTSELLLYVVHGTLHLVGYDDVTPALRHKMRIAEKEVFEALKIPYPGPEKNRMSKRGRTRRVKKSRGTGSGSGNG